MTELRSETHGDEARARSGGARDRVHPYDDLLDRVERPSRYVGGEYRARTAEVGPDPLHVVLGFPDAYEIGMSHQGLAILLALLDADPSVRSDRVFSPWPDMEAALRAAGRPLLTLDARIPLRDVDVLGLSLQYELTATNVLSLLDLGGVPLRSADRGERDPIVLGGGPIALHAEPIAPFFDLFLLGEAEDVLLPLLHDIRRLRRDGVTRGALLDHVARTHPGIYVPSRHTRTPDPQTGAWVPQPALDGGGTWPVPRNIADLSRHPFPTDGPVPTAEAVFDRVTVEVARGCQQGCRFCQAGMIYRPVRERPPAEVAQAVLGGVRSGGYEETSLSSLSTADYRGLETLVPALMNALDPRRVAVSVSSLRAYGLSDALLDEIVRVRKTGLTLAPEAGSERLRRVINKNVTEEQLVDAVCRAAARGWRRVKLYFMIGLPTETDDDVREIAALAARVRNAPQKAGGRRVDVTVSVSNHVPKPHGPFQWEGMDPPGELRRKQALLRDETRRLRLQLKVHDVAMSHLEGALARGDARLADVIEHAWRGGARFDGWDERFDGALWDEAFAATGVDPDRYLAPQPEDAGLPWDYADPGVRRSFLRAERRRAREERVTLACGAHDLDGAGAQDGRTPRCHGCGAPCDLAAPGPDPCALGADLDAVMATIALPPGAVTMGGDASIERWRLGYEKRGVARTLGHLDLQRHLVRTLRRAGVVLAYSKGFHPHPQIVFPPPLPVGAEGIAELVDVLVAAPASGDGEPDPGAVVAALNAVAIDGVSFASLERLPAQAPKVSRAVGVADHVLRVDRATTAEALGVAPESVEAALEGRLAAWSEGDGPLPVPTIRKGVHRQVDVRPALVLAGDPALVAPHRDVIAPGPGDALVGLRLSLHGDGAGVRPEEILAVVVPGVPVRRRYRVGLHEAVAVPENAGTEP